MKKTNHVIFALIPNLIVEDGVVLVVMLCWS